MTRQEFGARCPLCMRAKNARNNPEYRARRLFADASRRPLYTARPPMEMHQCISCRVTLLRTAFSPKAGSVIGIHSICRVCACAKRKAEYAANPEAYRDYKARFYSEHVELMRDRAASKRATYSARIRQSNARRRAREIGAAGGGVTEDDWLEILETFNRCCAYCLKHETVVGALQQDHVIALVNGGAHEPSNIVPACRHCNPRKGCRPLWEMLRRTSDRFFSKTPRGILEGD